MVYATTYFDTVTITNPFLIKSTPTALTFYKNKKKLIEINSFSGLIKFFCIAISYSLFDKKFEIKNLFIKSFNNDVEVQIFNSRTDELILVLHKESFDYYSKNGLNELLLKIEKALINYISSKEKDKNEI